MNGLALLEEADIRVRKIRYHSEDTCRTVFTAVVLEWRPRLKVWAETKKEITCVGQFYGLVESDHLHVHVEEYDDPKHGVQYQIYKSNRVQPGTEIEMRKFLISVKGVGAVFADMLMKEFGMDVFTAIVDDPSCMNRLGLNKTAKESLYQAIVENSVYEELLMFLQLNGISLAHTAEIYRNYGASAVSKIRDNPYALYLDGVVDFRTADKLNLSLGQNANPAFRAAAGVLACIRESSEKDGDVYVKRIELDNLVAAFLSRTDSAYAELSELEVQDALDTLARDGYLVVDSVSLPEPAIYLKSGYYAETRAAERLAILMTAPKRFNTTEADATKALSAAESEVRLTLAAKQKQAVLTALTSPVSILTGGPGTGKTQTLTMIIKAIKNIDPSADVRLCAPTGKASIRMRELTGERAETIHRLVGYPQAILEENELVCDFVIADEFSMCDIQLCSWLFNCVCSGARVVIVGDHEQLPSVGPGLVLRDMITSGAIPVSQLKEVFRQSGKSLIVENAHAIINHPDGCIPMKFSQEKGGDFYMIEADTQRQILKTVKQCVNKLVRDGVPVDNMEVLSPVHSGLLGTNNLNMVLQDLLNSGALAYSTRNYELRKGDKVIQTKNNYDLSVFNGETGIVKEIEFSVERALLVEFPDRRVWYDAEQVEELELAYAITTHKSQGSEFDTVIIPVHETILYNFNRNLFYTAITRAKKRVILVGTKSAMEIVLRKQGSVKRHSNLVARLRKCIGTAAAA